MKKEKVTKEAKELLKLIKGIFPAETIESILKSDISITLYLNKHILHSTQIHDLSKFVEEGRITYFVACADNKINLHITNLK